MSKKSKSNVLAGSEYELLDNGVILVRRCVTNPTDLPPKRGKTPDYLSLVDHSLHIKKKAYKKALLKEETEFNHLVRQLQKVGKSLIIVFQGRDGAGKSGASKKIMEAVDSDPKLFGWVPIGPPTEDERAHPYLWRFYTGERMPKVGQIRVFDRSWAERLLVEVVDELASPAALRRSVAEIRAFEWLLESQGAVLVKFWMDISKNEQLRRFKARAASKPWKLSTSDKKARKQWVQYTKAANAMMFNTGTQYAPWNIISSEDKNYSRVTVLQAVNAALRAALKK